MKRFIHTLMGLLALVGPALLATVPVSAASAPNLYFSSQSLSVNKGSNFSLALHINPNGTPINAVNVVVTYPQNDVTFAGLDKTSSAFDTFVPATPTAQNGSVTFAAAMLASGSSTASSLIGTFNFTAKVAGGSDTISLDGSQAANGGPAIHATTTDTNVSFAAANGSQAAADTVTISDVTVSSLTTSGATINWKTDTPTTGAVDFGSTDSYGLTASSDKLGTDHSVDLGQHFAGRTTVHFRVTATDSSADSKSSTDQTFRTVGYTVRLTVTDSKGAVVSGKNVSTVGGKIATTDNSGTATLKDVPPGTQKIVISGAKDQFITVKAAVGADAEKPQDIKLTAASSPSVGLYIGIGLILVIIILALFATWWQNGHQHQKPAEKPAAK